MATHTSNLRKTAVKWFFVGLVVVIAIDTFPLGISNEPGPFSFLYSVKSAIRPALRPIGLWQAEWRLFAPDPVLSNCWWTIEVKGPLSADLNRELRRTDQQGLAATSGSLSWNSPFWGEVRPAAKFFKRRHIAYSRRLSEFPVAVVEDFADDWVRERFGDRLHPLGDLPDPLGDLPVENGASENAAVDTESSSQPCALEITVFRNELKLAHPDDGTLPSREDTVWLSVTDKYLQRRYGE